MERFGIKYRAMAKHRKTAVFAYNERFIDKVLNVGGKET